MFFSLSAFAERVISPVSGTFANRQCLVLDLAPGEEAYYSYTNTNPLNSGFAYDGPVLIEMSGKVSLRVAVVSGEKKEQYEINYTVSEKNPFAKNSTEGLFIDKINAENVLLCSSENLIFIPESLTFSVGDGEKPVLRGGTLSVSANNRLSRYIPCTVSDGSSNWRFVIYLTGGEAGTFSLASVPFEISDWTQFTFTGKNLIWSIDGGLWSASKETITLDRTQEHVISWQNVDYSPSNPVESFELPPKPELTKDNFEKAVVFNIDGDFRYRMKIVTSGVSGESHADSGLHSSLTFDTFEGDYIDTTAVFAFYCDGVYQGEFSVPYIIDRQPPLPPKFDASEPGFYARHDVSLNILAEEGASVYYNISGPHIVSSNSYIDGNSEFDFLRPGPFSAYNSQKIFLRSGNEKAVYYKIFAYAEDSSGNVSGTSEYKVIIDEFNYFVDANATDFAADGSRLHPYNSFSQMIKVINAGKFVHFFVSGNIPVAKGTSVVTSNCSITGMADARFVLSPSSVVVVRDASLEVQNCVIEKDLASSSEDSDQRLLVFERAAASFEDCEILGNFSSSGTPLSSEASIVTFRNSGIISQASTYACGISAINSRIQLDYSHFSSISDTAVNFSLKGGSFEMNGCDCKVISHLGRILESTGANLKLVSNKYTGDFDRTAKGISPIWTDEKSMLIEDKNNEAIGF